MRPMNKLLIRKTIWERGYTLIELLVIISVVALLSGVLAMTYNLITRTASMNNESSVALLQVTEASRWITKDVQSADNITGYSDIAWNCVMNCYDWTGTSIDTVNVEYVIQNGVLLRIINQSQTVEIARYLSGPGTDTLFAKSASEDNAYILTLKVVYNNASVSKTYKINKRIPGGS